MEYIGIEYFPGAFGIAFVTTVGSFVMAKNVEDRQPQPWDANRDMIASRCGENSSALFLGLLFQREVLTEVF